jgi:hypothetical protein
MARRVIFIVPAPPLGLRDAAGIAAGRKTEAALPRRAHDA